VNLNIALKRKASVLPILYNGGFLYVLWVTYDITQGDLCDWLENWGVKRLKVPPCLRRSGFSQAGVKVLQHTRLPFSYHFIQLGGELGLSNCHINLRF
jgi:hypothetical protein